MIFECNPVVGDRATNQHMLITTGANVIIYTIYKEQKTILSYLLLYSLLQYHLLPSKQYYFIECRTCHMHAINKYFMSFNYYLLLGLAFWAILTFARNIYTGPYSALAGPGQTKPSGPPIFIKGFS